MNTRNTRSQCPIADHAVLPAHPYTDYAVLPAHPYADYAVLPAHPYGDYAVLAAHPYEEVAFDRVALENGRVDLGAGMVGELPEPMAWEAFADHVKKVLGGQGLKHTAPVKSHVQRIAMCGGSGAFLIGDAARVGADVYVTSDVKYHEYFGALGSFQLLDVGHYESEWQTSTLIANKINEKFPKFAVHLSTIQTNPVTYR